MTMMDVLTMKPPIKHEIRYSTSHSRLALETPPSITMPSQQVPSCNRAFSPHALLGVHAALRNLQSPSSI